MTNAIVIDDDFDTVEVLAEFLNLKGIDVIGKGYDGLDGVRLYERLKPDVVFSDVMMPINNGFFLLESIKKINPSARVVMVTADLSASTADKLQKLAADGIIYKPFEIHSIMNLISSFENNAGYSKEKLNITNRGN